jgi:hypothetical protein
MHFNWPVIDDGLRTGCSVGIILHCHKFLWIKPLWMRRDLIEWSYVHAYAREACAYGNVL